MEAKMIFFLLTFLCLYGGINFYFFFRARSILHFSGFLQGVILTLIILLILAPVIVRVLESLHYEHLARLAAITGYIWMAFVFLFFLSSVSLELIRIIHKLIVPGTSTLTLKAITFGLSAFLAAGLVVYGYFDAQQIRVRNLQITTDQILPGDGKLRIVQISDVHVGIIIRNSRLNPLLESIRESRPDILVSTGDLLDGELDNIMGDAKRFAAIKAPYGKFAILGNHEYYAGLNKSIAFTQEAGFRILRDDIAQAAGITIFGQDDITGRRWSDSGKRESFKKALSEKHDGFVLLLKHQPRIDEWANFNLHLCGHTHGGQIFPFGLITKLYFPKNYGLHELAPNRQLYVSRGTGTWGPPVRVFAPPEITVIDLTGRKR
jgi:hypothetical protein